MSSRPAPIERLAIAGPAGTLEALGVEPRASVDGQPAASGYAARCYAVLCHPHPLFGGTMDNKVIYTLARALQDSAIPTLRFNFRGVGASAGRYDEGEGETADAAAVADYGARRWPGRQLLLAGFSFGAFVALRLACARATAGLITVAPPVGRFDFSGLSAPECPWWVIQGDADELVDAQAVVAWSQAQRPPPILMVVPGVGHFFHGRLAVLRDAVIDAIRSG